MADLPSLTRNDLATALFGVGTRITWLKEQRPRCQFWREEIAKSEAALKKLNDILGGMDPPQIYEDETNFLGDGDEEVYAPTDEARRLQAEVAEQVKLRDELLGAVQ